MGKSVDLDELERLSIEVATQAQWDALIAELRTSRKVVEAARVVGAPSTVYFRRLDDALADYDWIIEKEKP